MEWEYDNSLLQRKGAVCDRRKEPVVSGRVGSGSRHKIAKLEA